MKNLKEAVVQISILEMGLASEYTKGYDTSGYENLGGKVVNSDKSIHD